MDDTTLSNNVPAQPDSQGEDVGLSPADFDAFFAQREQPKAPEPSPDFDSQLRQHLGMGVEDIRALRDSVHEIQRQRDLDALRSAWGESYEETQNMVMEALKAMPEPKRNLYNNREGALALAEFLREQESLKQQAPSLDGGTPAPRSSKKYAMTGSEYNALSSDEKKARWAELQAYTQQGLIDWNS